MNKIIIKKGACNAITEIESESLDFQGITIRYIDKDNNINRVYDIIIDERNGKMHLREKA